MLLKKFNLNKKTALITGGAGLLGFEHCYALLESGAKVIITDIDEEQLFVARNKLKKHFNSNSILTHVMDVSCDNSIKKVHDWLDGKEKVDILINNAAIDPKVRMGKDIIGSSRLENFSLESWNKQITVGLTGAFLCSKIFGTTMAHNKKGGVILNISSDLSISSPDQRLYKKSGLAENQQPVKPVTYSVIKAGIVGLTKYLSTYWIEHGIRCNALSPGGVYNKQNEEFVDKVKLLIPMNRMADKDEYRSTVQYLCSDASSYLNGQNIIVDGGRSVW
jgi:NAD(P)-dependent dehydrogenase (short-subunit alcohol dehydrogenase family)